MLYKANDETSNLTKHYKVFSENRILWGILNIYWQRTLYFIRNNPGQNGVCPQVVDKTHPIWIVGVIKF